MQSVRETSSNELKFTRVREVLEELSKQVLTRGFFGSVSVELVIQNGTIQKINRRIEQFEKA